MTTPLFSYHRLFLYHSHMKSIGKCTGNNKHSTKLQMLIIISIAPLYNLCIGISLESR